MAAALSALVAAASIMRLRRARGVAANVALLVAIAAASIWPVETTRAVVDVMDGSRAFANSAWTQRDRLRVVAASEYDEVVQTSVRVAQAACEFAAGPVATATAGLGRAALAPAEALVGMLGVAALPLRLGASVVALLVCV